MKKIAFLLLAILPFISCEDTETNDVALQAKINNRLYQSTGAQASLIEGELVIQGSNMDESLTLTLSGLSEGDFIIKPGSTNQAVFADAFGNVFKTRSGGEGLVTITEVDEGNKTLTGTFKFSAIMPSVDTIYVSKGFLYHVPYDGGSINIPGADNFTAKVDGNLFNPMGISATSTGNSIVILGTTAEASIVITVPVAVEAGTYTLPRNRYSAQYQDANGPQTTSGGEIKIIEHNSQLKTIKGNFSFITDLSEITEGEFEVSYQ